MKRYVKIMVCMAMMVSLLVPTRANAASLDDVPRKMAGYSVVTEKASDVTLAIKVISELVNSTPGEIVTTDTFSTSQSITFASGCSASISGAISADSGVVSGELGATIEAEYSFEENYVRSYTKQITATVPAFTTYKLKAKIKGDWVHVYYKKFAVWITTDSGDGLVCVPKYCSWVCE